MSAPSVDGGRGDGDGSQRRVLATCLAAFPFFVGFGLTIPTLTRFTVDVVGGSEGDVGMVFAAQAVTAVLVRPVIGHVGDVHGRVLLVRSGAGVVAAALALHILATSLPALVLLRMLVGIGQAAVFVGVVALVLDLAPVSRRGRAANHVMVVAQLGIGSGPLLAAPLIAHGYPWAWAAAAALAATSGVFFPSAFEPGRPTVPRGPGRRRALHPAARRPGVVVGLGMLGYTGWLAFVPLHAATVGLDQVGLLYLVSASAMVSVRIIGADLPDRLGPRRAASVSLGIVGASLSAMAASQTAAGLVATSVGLGIGVGAMVPALMSLAHPRTQPSEERAQASATFTLFLDVAAAAGPAGLGVVAQATSTQTAFAVGAAVAAIGLPVLYLRVRRRPGPVGDAP